MIELPREVGATDFQFTLVDNGFFQRGAAILRVDRPGNHFRVALNLPPMEPDQARIVWARLMRAKRLGLRVDLPLLVPQGVPGATVIDGDDQAGTTLLIRGATPYYACKEGFWLTVEDEDGARYLHNCAIAGIADASGDLEIGIEPALSGVLEDGSTVRIAKPGVEGALPEELNWTLSVDQLVRGATIVIEEAG